VEKFKKRGKKLIVESEFTRKRTMKQWTQGGAE